MFVNKWIDCLYHDQLGGIANIYVTKNNYFKDNYMYTGNIALHVQDNPLHVLQRRMALSKIIGKPIQWLEQVHGNIVHNVSDIHTVHQSIPTADGLITQESKLALAIMSADCLPVMFTAHNIYGDKAIAAAHAGWRGLCAGILNHTVLALRQAVNQAIINVHLAPCIGVTQFEVGVEVKKSFTDQCSEYAIAFTYKSIDKYLCDLNLLARQILQFNGICAKYINGGGFCTVSDPRLASYRRRTITGRFASIIAMI